MQKITLPTTNAHVIEVKGSTVDFLEYKVGKIKYISFDTSDRGAPEPMQNALLGLSLITDNKTRLVMINHRVPEGLLKRLTSKFEYIQENLDDKSIAIEFFVTGNEKIKGIENIDNRCSG